MSKNYCDIRQVFFAFRKIAITFSQRLLMKSRSRESFTSMCHLHQGSVYASMAYNELIKDTNIIRSMSRAGKPTDNPINEALNGWIKEELCIEFQVEQCWQTPSTFKQTIERYVKYYNNQRPCFAIGYDTPENYRKRFYKGELPRRQTFENRVLSTEPKFVQKKRQNADNESGCEDVSTFGKEKN